jgi:hypothetical protein
LLTRGCKARLTIHLREINNLVWEAGVKAGTTKMRRIRRYKSIVALI